MRDHGGRLALDPRLPAAKRGTTNDALVLNLDVAPTVLAAAGAKVPEVMQGRDVAPLYLAAKSGTPSASDKLITFPRK